jgi:hypothetical protein
MAALAFGISVPNGDDRMKETLEITGSSVGAIALAFALALGASGLASLPRAAEPLTNISFAGSPNSNEVGKVDPDTATIKMQVGVDIVIGGYRSRECGDPAPEFERLMRQQVDYGLKVPDGVTLFDGGVGYYSSGRCGGRVAARAIAARAQQSGTFKLRFFGGKVVKKLKVE